MEDGFAYPRGYVYPRLNSTALNQEDVGAHERVTLSPGIFLVATSIRSCVESQGHSAAGRIRPTEKSNDPMENRTRDLSACSTVAELRYRAPPEDNRLKSKR
jgi:hypothetical protein